MNSYSPEPRVVFLDKVANFKQMCNPSLKQSIPTRDGSLIK